MSGPRGCCPRWGAPVPSRAPKPDDPCSCGSGRRFADCHGPIFDAPPAKAIPIAQEIYASDWGVNAAQYQAEGLYTSLAGELAACRIVRRVLDIGCGLGQGLEALATVVPESERLIIGVDENPACLERAAERLQVPPTGIASSRIKLEKQLSGYFESRPALAPLKLHGEILLIHADLMVPDPAFEAWLDQVGPFDAITLWFSGVHKARSMTKVSKRIGAMSDADLRRALEDQVMEVAGKRLRPGGILQVVQRCAGHLPAERRRRAAEVAHIMGGWPFDLVSVTGYPYEEPTAEGAMLVNSREFDSAGMPRFALSTLFRRKAND